MATLPCDKCGSSDGVEDYVDHSHCFVCGDHIKKDKEIEDQEQFDKKATPNDSISHHSSPVSSLLLLLRVGPIADRRISEETCKKYGVGFTENGDQAYPYYDKNGQLKAYKFRKSEVKGFLSKGDINESVLFGQQLFSPGSSKQITITEGETDALAAYQMQGSRYPVVSVKSASSAKRDCVSAFEYLNSFEQIVVNFDKDEPHKHPATGETHYPGQEAAQQVAALFPLGKVRILLLDKAKDACDYLKQGWEKNYIDEWWKAPTFIPDGLKFAKDMWGDVVKKDNYETIPYPWEGLNDLTYGIRLSELVTFTADPKIGKTQILREIVYSALSNTDKGLGLIFLEEPNKHTLLGLMSLSANKPLHLPDVRSEVSDDELMGYFKSCYPDDRVVLWDHFGSSHIEKVLDKIRHMAALGCKYIVLDHLSIVVSDQNGDERKKLDEIATKLKTLCMELNIAVLTVVHQNRKGEIRGSMGIEQLSNIVIKLHRNKLDEDEWRRNITEVVVQDNRFCGRTGPASFLYYESTTGRLSELTKTEVEQFKSKEMVIKEDHWS